MVEVALQPFPTTVPESEEFPIYESATLPHKRAIPNTYNSLPWATNRLQPNPQWQTAYWPYKPQPYVQQENSVLYGAGEAMAVASSSNEASSSFVLPAPNGKRFYAPPPSAASISTYGIAKPGNKPVIKYYPYTFSFLVGIRYPPPLITRKNKNSTTSSSSSESLNQRQRRPKRRRKRQKHSNDQTPRQNLSEQNSNDSLPPPPYSQND